MLKITDNKGFHMTFANGWTASVQFGPGNYGTNYNYSFSAPKSEMPDARTAECAAWSKTGSLTAIWEDAEDTVVGYLNANEVLKFLNLVASQPQS